MNVLCVEGMGNFPVIEQQLVPYLPKEHTFTFCGWNETPNILFDGVIGHSLGGSAAISFAQKNKPKWLVTLDARRDSNASWFDVIFPLPGMGGLQAPIPETYNFMHTPPVLFPGYAVTGAKLNQSLFCTHFNIPGQQAVVDLVTRLLGG